jgi:hypothetical protein
MSVVVAGAAGGAPGAAAVVDGAGTDADGVGGSDEVGAVHAPDITHHNTNTNAPMAITLIKSRSTVGLHAQYTTRHSDISSKKWSSMRAQRSFANPGTALRPALACRAQAAAQRHAS